MKTLIRLILKEVARRSDMTLDEFIQLSEDDPLMFYLQIAEVVYGMK